MRAAIPALIVFAALWLFSRLAPGLDAWAFGLAGLTLAVPLALLLDLVTSIGLWRRAGRPSMENRPA